MAYTQADLDAIKAAIGSGQLVVRYGESSVTYRSLDEMIRVRDEIQKEVSPPTRDTTSYASYSRD